MVALVCHGLARKEFAKIDVELDLAVRASRGDLAPLRVATKKRAELQPAFDELERRIRQHCGDHGNGQGGPRVVKAIARFQARQDAYSRALAQAQRTDPMGLSPPHVDGAEAPVQAVEMTSAALAAEALAAISAALAEWGPVLAPAL